MRLAFVSQAVQKSYDAQEQAGLQKVGVFVNASLKTGAAVAVKKDGKHQIVFKDEVVQKTFSPEEQAGLQNIAALINQMLQSGMATMQPESAEDAGHQVAMDLSADQQHGRIGGPVPNEDIEPVQPGKVRDAAEEETKVAPHINPKKVAALVAAAVMKAFQEQEIADGADSTGFSGHPNEDVPFQRAGHPAGKGEDEHPGTDASDTFEDRLEDIPVYDEENAEGSQQGASIKDGDPGKGSPAKPGVTKMQLVRMLAKHLGYSPRVLAKALSINYDREVAKDTTAGIYDRMDTLERAVEKLLVGIGPALGFNVEKAQKRNVPVMTSPADEDRTALLRILGKELNLGGEVTRETQPRSREAVHKSLTGVLTTHAGEGVWPGGQSAPQSGSAPEGWPEW